jgi:hypothetical protein
MSEVSKNLNETSGACVNTPSALKMRFTVRLR